MTLEWNDIAAIKGCLLNGATPEQIYAAFEGQYSMNEITAVQAELIKDKMVKYGERRSLVLFNVS